MRITQIDPQKKRDRYNVSIDNHFWSGLSGRTITEFKLYPGKEVTDADLDEILQKEIDGRVYDRCIRKVGLRPQSEWELRTYIGNVLRKNLNKWLGSGVQEDIKAAIPRTESNVMTKLQDEGIVSDETFARWWVDQRNRSGMKGWIAIRAELLQKRVPPSIIDSVRLSGGQERAIARRAYEKYCRRVDVNKCKQRLAGRGFDWDIIEEVLKDDESL